MKIVKFFLKKANKILFHIYCIKNHINIQKNTDIVNTNIEKYCHFSHDCSVRNSNIGLRSSIGRYSIINNADIGKYCSISWFVTIGAISHPLDRLSTHAFTYRKQFGIADNDLTFDKSRVIIGNDVWIGCNAIIMPGITVGDGAVIGAGSVVTKNVEPYSIVVGNPAKEIKKRFKKDIIDKLMNLSWWNFSDDVLKSNINFMKVAINDETLEHIATMKGNK